MSKEEIFDIMYEIQCEWENEKDELLETYSSNMVNFMLEMINNYREIVEMKVNDKESENNE